MAGETQGVRGFGLLAARFGEGGWSDFRCLGLERVGPLLCFRAVSRNDSPGG